MNQINEKMVEAWLQISSVLMNHRMVKGMSFNEAFVCNLLNRSLQENPNQQITATWLCTQTGMLKSMMNKTLNSLEDKGMIHRVRSTTDRRNVSICLRPENLEDYYKEHENLLGFVNCIQTQLGEDKIKQAVQIFGELTDVIEHIERGDHGWEYKSS